MGIAKFFFMALGLSVLVACSGQGCAGGRLSVSAEVRDACSPMGMTEEDMVMMLSASDMDRESGFSRSDEMNSISDNCGSDWDCLHCCMAVVNQVYGF